MNKYVTNLTLPNGTNLLIKDSECRTNLSNEITRATKKETALQNSIDAINNAQHPIGSIYMSMTSNSPASLFGGTWEQIKDKFLLSAGNTYQVGSTGGETTHTLTVDEMPSHTHKSYSVVLPSPNGDGNVQSASNNSYWKGGGLDDTTTVGGGAAHNNMPPYLTVYMWKRIA